MVAKVKTYTTHNNNLKQIQYSIQTGETLTIADH